MWRKTKKYFRDYCEHSSIIGFYYVSEKRSKGERLLWLLLVALAIAVSIYFIMQMWYKYDENPFIVSLATRAVPIFSIPFPAVTICPVVKANRSIFNYTDVVHRIWDEKPVTPDEIRTAQYMTLICDSEDVNNHLPQNTSFTEDFYDKIDEMDSTGALLDWSICIFMGRIRNCSDILIPIVLDNGICYTFNMLQREEIYRPTVYHYKYYHQHDEKSQWTNDDGYNKGSSKDAYPRRALQSGADSSLMIMLPQVSEDTDYLCMNNAGYTITIHSPNTIPKTSKDFFVLPLNSASQIVLEPELMTTSATVKAYKQVHRQCYFSDERYLEHFLSYTQENCFLECLTNYTLKKCGCVNFYMPHKNTTKICGNAFVDCMQEAETEVSMLEVNSEIEKNPSTYSACSCLPLCTQLTYYAETSMYEWPWREYFRARKNLNMTEEFTNVFHFSQLNVFFKSDQFLPSEKNELYGPFDFLSNFGGLLGLFTGFSLLSAVELIYYMSVRLWCNKMLYNDVSGPPND